MLHAERRNWEGGKPQTPSTFDINQPQQKQITKTCLNNLKSKTSVTVCFACQKYRDPRNDRILSKVWWCLPKNEQQKKQSKTGFTWKYHVPPKIPWILIFPMKIAISLAHPTAQPPAARGGQGRGGALLHRAWHLRCGEGPAGAAPLKMRSEKWRFCPAQKLVLSKKNGWATRKFIQIQTEWNCQWKLKNQSPSRHHCFGPCGLYKVAPF